MNISFKTSLSLVAVPNVHDIRLQEFFQYVPPPQIPEFVEKLDNTRHSDFVNGFAKTDGKTVEISTPNHYFYCLFDQFKILLLKVFYEITSLKNTLENTCMNKTFSLPFCLQISPEMDGMQSNSKDSFPEVPQSSLFVPLNMFDDKMSHHSDYYHQPLSRDPAVQPNGSCANNENYIFPNNQNIQNLQNVGPNIQVVPGAGCTRCLILQSEYSQLKLEIARLKADNRRIHHELDNTKKDNNILNSKMAAATEAARAMKIKGDFSYENKTKAVCTSPCSQLTKTGSKRRNRSLLDRMAAAKAKHPMVTFTCSGTCNRECLLFSRSDKEQVNQQFWSLPPGERTAWILRVVKDKPVKCRSGTGNKKKKSVTREYSMPKDSELLVVCQKTFITTLGFKSASSLDGSFIKGKKGPDYNSRPYRPPPNKVDRQYVRTHINSYCPLPPHESKLECDLANAKTNAEQLIVTSRRYLPCFLSIKKLYKDFALHHPHFKCGLETYRQIFKSENIGFSDHKGKNNPCPCKDFG